MHAISGDYVDLGSTPWEEECVQVQTGVDYLPAMRAECQRYIERIRQVNGPEPTGASLQIMSNPHDFGTYLSVVCYYCDSNEEARAYAFKCDDNCPARWQEGSDESA